MSQAGRYAHQQNQKRHAQRGFNQPVTKVAETIETATWMQDGMRICRELAYDHKNAWTIEQYRQRMDLLTGEAERQLRYLSKLGFLRMSSLRKDGLFVCYLFSLVNPDLPK